MKNYLKESLLGSQDGLVVINQASHLWDPGSTLGRMWGQFSVDLNLAPRVFSGYSGFPPPQNRPPVNYIWLGLLRDHTWIVWRQPWAPSHAFDPIPSSRLILQSPCIGSGQLKAHLHLIIHGRGSSENGLDPKLWEIYLIAYGLWHEIVFLVCTHAIEIGGFFCLQ